MNAPADQVGQDHSCIHSVPRMESIYFVGRGGSDDMRSDTHCLKAIFNAVFMECHLIFIGLIVNKLPSKVVEPNFL